MCIVGELRSGMAWHGIEYFGRNIDSDMTNLSDNLHFLLEASKPN